MTDSTATEGRLPGDRGDGNRLRMVAVASLVLALVAVGLAGWAVLRERPTAGAAEPAYSDSQRADAKRTTCAAVEFVRQGVSLNTNLQPAGGPDDVTGSLAVAANARLALSNGGQYLLVRVDPATPEPLAATVASFANTLLDIGAAATAGITNGDSDQAARLRDADAANTTIAELCK
jgi:hypothetical protein